MKYRFTILYILSLCMIVFTAAYVGMNSYTTTELCHKTLSVNNWDGSILTAYATPTVNDESDSVYVFTATNTDSSCGDNVKAAAKGVKAIFDRIGNHRSERIVKETHFISLIDIGQPLSILGRLNI